MCPTLHYSVHNAVSTELHPLLNEGIIKKIDASLWVSPIAISEKKEKEKKGGIHMCVDLTSESTIKPS